MRTILSKLTAAALAAAGLVAGSFDASAQSTTLIGWQDTWEYNDETTSATSLHGTGWELLNYDINSAPGWKMAPALFGNDTAAGYISPALPFAGQGINGFTTPLNRAIAAASDRVTFYFRKKFTYNGPTLGVILEASYVNDDGTVFYLNGVEISRTKMSVQAPDPVTWDTLGQNHDSTAGPDPVVVEGFQYIRDQPSAALVNGENILAVELHQSSTTSSDVSFALQLQAIIPFTPVITDTTQPTNRIVIQNRSTTLIVVADGSRPVSYQWFFQPIGGGGFSPIFDATNSSYTITNMQATDEGDYYSSVVNPVGSVDSRVATVSFSTDSVAPSVVRVIGSADQLSVVVEYSEVVEEITATDAFSATVNGFGPRTIVLNPGGKSTTLTFDTPFGNNELLTLHQEGTQDLAENTMVPTDMEFRSWTASACAGLTMEVYRPLSTTDNNLATTLLVDPNYPNNPNEVLKLGAFDTREVYPDDTHEGYGARLSGLFIPPFSGPWRFFINSDDSSQVWLNPNGPSRAGRALIAQETGCCNAFAEPGAHTRTSAPQNLIGGQAYYIEALYKEGTGGDYCRIAARVDGDPTPAASLTPIPANWMGVPAAPVGAAGSFSISQQPANTTTVPNSTVTFSVGTSTDSLLCYQWRRGGIDIPFANGAQYSLVATPGDNGAVFSVVVSIVGGEPITSADATLTVEPDVTRPTVVSVTANAAGDSVVVTYSEPMGAATAGDPFNYLINGANPASVTVNSATVATLVPSGALVDCDPNVVTISGVNDLSGNAINPNPTTVNFTKPQVLVGNTATQIWRFEDTGADLTGTAWREAGYDDSTWVSGPAPLGLEDAAQMPAGWEIRTPIPNYVGARITMYFRTTFNLATAPQSITQLQLTQVVDDGVVYYINGKELSRLRMTDPITYASLSGGSTEPHPIEGPIDVPATDLVYGENVLSAEVHQSGTASSDIVFGMQLTANISACVPPLTITRSGANVIVTWPDASFTLQSAPAVTGPWGPQAGASGVSLNASSGNLFLRLIKQ